MGVKYWVFEAGRLSGPHGHDELMRLSGFSAESLVCREDARAGEPSNWRRACLAADLAVVLACRSTGAPEEPVPAAEPAVDPEIVGRIERRVAALSETVARLNETFAQEHAKALELARLSGEEGRQVRAIGAHLGGCERRAEALQSARARLESLFVAERHIEKYLGVRERDLAELTGKLDALRAESGDRRAGCSELERLNAGLREDLAELRRLFVPSKPPLPPAPRKPPLPPVRRKPPPLPPAGAGRTAGS